MFKINSESSSLKHKTGTLICGSYMSKISCNVSKKHNSRIFCQECKFIRNVTMGEITPFIFEMKSLEYP